jgi:hypothetical protein
MLVVVASGGILLGLSLIAGFPFWGRHLAPVFPFLVLVIASLMKSVWAEDQKKQYFFCALLCLALLGSSLLVRFQADHARDDYRGAAQIAQSAISRGDVVWWVAGTVPSEYYGLNFCTDENDVGANCVFGVKNPTDSDFSRLPPPDIVIVSKPDLNDKFGATQRFIEDHHFILTNKLMAFQVFGQP